MRWLCVDCALTVVDYALGDLAHTLASIGAPLATPLLPSTCGPPTLLHFRSALPLFGAATLERIGAMTLRKKLSCRTALRTLGGQILLDNFIIGPFIYFPIFYLFKEALQGEPSFSGLFQRSLQNYRRNFFQDNGASCALYIPADFIIFSVPLWARMYMIHGFSMTWTTILSFMRGV